MNELQKSFIQNGPSFLMHYNHKHDELGRFAETNGSSRLASKIDKRNEKIGKIDKELSSVRDNKKLAKYARFNVKVEKANAKAEKAMRKLAKGKALSNKEIRRLEKYEELKSKQASISEKESRIKDKRATLELEKSKLEKKNAKAEKKLEKLEEKKKKQQSDSDSSYHFDLSKKKYSKEDVSLANYMFANSGPGENDIWTKEEWDRAEEILDEEMRKGRRQY